MKKVIKWLFAIIGILLLAYILLVVFAPAETPSVPVVEQVTLKIGPRLKHGSIDELFADRTEYPEKDSVIVLRIKELLQSTDVSYVDLDRYADMARKDSSLFCYIDSLRYEARSSVMLDMSELTSARELAVFYVDNREAYPFLDDVGDLMVSQVDILPYEDVKEIHTILSGTNLGIAVDERFVPIRDSLIQCFVAELQDELALELSVIDDLRLSLLRDTEELIEERVAKIADLTLEEANNDYFGEILDLFVGKIKRLISSTVDQNTKAMVKSTGNKVLSKISNFSLSAYKAADSLMDKLGGFEDSTFLMPFDNLVLPAYVSQALPVPISTVSFVPILDYSAIRYYEDRNIQDKVVASGPVSGGLVYQPMTLSLPDQEMNRIIPDMGIENIGADVAVSADMSEDENDSFFSEFYAITAKYLQRIASGVGIANYTSKLCVENLHPSETRDSTITMAMKYAYAANMNRDNIFTSHGMMFPKETAYIDARKFEAEPLSYSYPLDKMFTVQKLKYREFNYDVQSIVLGMEASMNIPVKWISLLFDVGDFIAGMYVAMKVTELVSEDVSDFSQELAAGVCDSALRYVDGVFDELEKVTVDTYNEMCNYVYVNY